MVETKKTTTKTSTIAISALGIIAEASASSGTTSAPSGTLELTIIASVLLPFAAAALTPFLTKHLGENTALYGAGVSLACFLGVASQYGTTSTITFKWIPSLGINASFYVDGLSMLLGLLASGIGVLVFVYAREYMKGGHDLGRFYSTMLMFLGSMLGLVFSGNLILLFVFWELTSVSSFLLIGHHRESDSSLYAARKSMAITVGGGLFLLVAFILVHSATGTFSLIELLADPTVTQQTLRSSGLFLPVLGLLTVGASAKSAQIPLHIWLPDAMEAPTPVSAFLHSATMVKAGVFLLGRFRPVMVGTEWQLLLVSLGLVTMTVAGLLAVAASDIKGLLAYSTASHLGIIAASFGFVEGLGASTGTFHILNHALFKASLFMVAGIVAHEAGIRAISKLSGLRNTMPITTLIATLAGLSMAGIPPFGGFQSKELMFKSALHLAEHSGGIYWLFPVVAVVGGVFSFIYSLRFISLFYGEKKTEAHQPSKLFIAAPAVLLLAIVASSLAPQNAVDLVVQSAANSAGASDHLHVHLVPKISAPVGMSALTVLLGLVGFRGRETIIQNTRSLLTEYGFLRANWWYNSTLETLPRVSESVRKTIQHGRIRGYVAISALTMASLGTAGYILGMNSVPSLQIAPGTAFVLILGIGGGAALKLTRMKSQAAGVLTLSVVGAMIAIFYVLADAPDLALTQVTVETLSLIIFMLVLDRLPSYYGEVDVAEKAKNTVIALLVGATGFISVLVAGSVSPDKISTYFMNNSLSDGGGGNIVNVILVDFRGFDTMGEISVIAMAALAILVLLSSRNRGVLEGGKE